MGVLEGVVVWFLLATAGGTPVLMDWYRESAQCTLAAQEAARTPSMLTGWRCEPYRLQAVKPDELVVP